MRFVNLDGVILDIEETIREFWNQNPMYYYLPLEKKIKFLKDLAWQEILSRSKVINDSISILRQMDSKELTIVSKIYSIDNDGLAKIKYLRDMGVNQEVLLVPYKIEMAKFLNAKDNILIDNSIYELDNWAKMGGYPMFFDYYDDNVDSMGVENTNNYQRVRRIDEKIKKH